jgi:hypothetical protein
VLTTIAPHVRNDPATEAFEAHPLDQGEVECLKKLIPRPPSITKTLQRAIGRRLTITARVTMPRVRKSQQGPKVIRRRLVIILTRRTAKARLTNNVINRGGRAAAPSSSKRLPHVGCGFFLG